jgi:methylglyoxal synthase
MKEVKRIALVAHDNRKKDLIEWAEWNYDVLILHELVSTGTTGKLVEEAIKKRLHEKDARAFEVTKLKSGPLGGDQQLGALIAEGKVDIIIFLWDPMQPQPHDVDVAFEDIRLIQHPDRVQPLHGRFFDLFASHERRVHTGAQGLFRIHRTGRAV